MSDTVYRLLSSYNIKEWFIKAWSWFCQCVDNGEQENVVESLSVGLNQISRRLWVQASAATV